MEPLNPAVGTVADVIVVGAGYAGLSAALRLNDHGVTTIVLEAASRVGGRILTEHVEGGLVIDHGGQWVGPTQKNLLGLASRFECETFETFEVGDHIEVWHDGTRTPYVGIGPEDAVGVVEYDRTVERMSAMAATVNLREPWLTPNFSEWDQQNAGDFFRAQTRDNAALRRLAIMVQTVWCCEPREISYFHLLFYIASAGGYEQLMDTRGCAQDSRFSMGASAPAQAAAAELGPCVRLGEPVESVDHRADGALVRTASSEFFARRVVVAVPPEAASRIEFDPKLPPEKIARQSHSPMGRVIKVHAVFDKPFWRDEGLAGFATIYDAGPLAAIFDNSPDDGSCGVLVGFIHGDLERDWVDKDPELRREAVLQCMARAIGPGAARALTFTEKLWSRDQFVHGGYGAVVAPGGWNAGGAVGWRIPTGVVHWAGTETASHWNGYMDGAIESGYRAADEILSDMGLGARNSGGG